MIDGVGYAIGGSTAIPWYEGVGEQDDEDVPKAFLNYIWIDPDLDTSSMKVNYVPLTAAALETGIDVPHELLSLTEVVTDPGYVYVYISNDGDDEREVYFDDFSVGHVKSPIVQSQDYYPFGLAFNEYSRENAVPNPYQFGGKEKQDELSTNWLDFGARTYMPDVGRWTGVDRLAERTYNWTPYRFGYNNPVRFFDRDGMTEEERQKAVEWARNFVKNNPTKKYIQNGQDDCSWLVNAAIMAAGMKDHKMGSGLRGANNGVALLAANMRQQNGLNGGREGDMVTFRSTRSDHKGEDGEFDHTGMITKVFQDENGSVTGYQVANFQGAGPRLLDYYFADRDQREKNGKTIYFDLKGIYQWDTPDEDNTVYYNGPLDDVVVVYGKRESYTPTSSAHEAFEAMGVRGFESWRTEQSKKKLAGKLMGDHE